MQLNLKTKIMPTKTLETQDIQEHYWTPTMKLRVLEKVITHPNGFCSLKDVLQQYYVSNLGAEKWEDIPVERE